MRARAERLTWLACVPRVRPRHGAKRAFALPRGSASPRVSRTGALGFGEVPRMFEGLTGKLGQVFDRLRGRGALSEADVDAALGEVRLALLEADVALPVVKDLVAAVKAKAVGGEVLKSVTPGQMVIKIVHDHLVAALGAEAAELNLRAAPPAVILMVGLQGSGKTTTTAKLALRLRASERKKVLLASLDTKRPAAQEQLAILGLQA